VEQQVFAVAGGFNPWAKRWSC